jgi:hypothetical protein
VSYDSTTKKATLDPSADLTLGTQYTATVKGGASGAKDKAGNPLASDKVWSFTTAKIAAPTGLTATRAGSKTNQSIKLAWTDNSSNEDTFIIERSVNNGSWSELTRVGANATSYTDGPPLSKGTKYSYRVRAHSDTYGDSTYSNTASVTTR